jgi:hypothetical protein
MTIKERFEILKIALGPWLYISIAVDVGVIALVLYLLFG